MFRASGWEESKFPLKLVLWTEIPILLLLLLRNGEKPWFPCPAFKILCLGSARTGSGGRGCGIQWEGGEVRFDYWIYSADGTGTTGLIARKPSEGQPRGAVDGAIASGGS